VADCGVLASHKYFILPTTQLAPSCMLIGAKSPTHFSRQDLVRQVYFVHVSGTEAAHIQKEQEATLPQDRS
jgi:hypothetical protein